nr:hypothetical protein 15 [bacterium]
MGTEWGKINWRRKRFFAKYARLFKAAYKKSAEPLIEQIKQDPDTALNGINSLSMEPLRETFIQLYGDVGSSFARLYFDRYKKDMLDSAWYDRLRQYAENEAGELIVTIQHTGRKEMKRILEDVLKQGFQTGEGIVRVAPTQPESISEKIARAFAKDWGKAAGWMGRRVAQTEVIRASNAAAIEGVESLGIAFVKVWLAGPTAPKFKRRHDLVAAANQRVEQSAMFDVNGWPARYPGDPNLPAHESINCHCAVSARPLDDIDTDF